MMSLCKHLLINRLIVSKTLRTFASHASKTKKIGLIGAPFSYGLGKEGTHLCPTLIRNKGLVEQLQLLKYDILDYGDIKITNGDNKKKDLIKNESEIYSNAIKELSDNVTKCLDDERFALTIGGDSLLSIGTIIGHQQKYKDISVIWIDAHSDLKTAVTVDNVSSMSASILINQVHSRIEDDKKPLLFNGISSCIDASNIAYIGLRASDRDEIKILDELKIAYYTMRDIDKLGIFEVISRALDKVNPKLDKTIHVSFDIDSIDAFFAPSTANPIPGGLTLREAFSIGEEIANTKLLKAFDLMEVNPLVGTENDVQTTLDLSIRIIQSFLGKGRKQFLSSKT